jgi:hypothetical protein
MTEQRFAQLRGLFEAALERDGTTRTAFLTEACAGDDELFIEVQKLIDSHEHTSGIFDVLLSEASIRRERPFKPHYPKIHPKPFANNWRRY